LIGVKIACIWHRTSERSLIERSLQHDEPSWQVSFFRFTEAASLEKLLLILRGGFDAVLLHLSTPQCAALKLVELYHRDKLSVRILLTSRTDADQASLRALFAAVIHPDNNILDVAEQIRSAVSKPAHYLDASDLERAIVAVFNSDRVLSAQYMNRFEESYRGPYTFDDYRRLSQACLVEDTAAPDPMAPSAVFISYSNEDEPLADEIRQALTGRSVKVFMASRSLTGGDRWEDAIRDSIVASQEMLIIVTPKSIRSAWVLVEAGAGWALGKRITPCILSVDPAELPEAISKHQARSIVTKKDRNLLIREVCLRLGAAASTTSDPKRKRTKD
jgi:DNA-binding NarL/FixJ family response regulator